jgi:sugar phosphate isomerase/epimerase
MSTSKLLLGLAPTRNFVGTWEEIAKMCQKYCFDGVEFKYELPFILPERWSWRMIQRIRTMAREANWFISVHGPYTNIGALLARRWRNALDEHLRALEVAQILEAKTYTIHPGWVERKWSTPELLQRCQENTARALNELVSNADEIAICLENQHPASDKEKAGITPVQLHSIVHDLPQVYFTFDVGHAQLYNKDPVGFLFALGPERVRLAHLHDNTGEDDTHLPPGLGNVNWSAFLKLYQEREYKFPLFLEINGNELDFENSRKVLIKLWDSLTFKTKIEEKTWSSEI